jgi:ribonuclease G
MGEGHEEGAENAPLEAEAVLPAEVEEIEARETASAEPETEEAHEEEHRQEGAKKWRGRRRRGRGRGRFGERDEREAPSQPAPEPQAEPAEAVARHEHREPYERKPEPQAFESMVLPGESLSKYGGGASASESLPPQAAPPVRTARPSTEYTINSAQFSPGSMVLPGETIAKYQHDRPSASTVTAEPPVAHEDQAAPAQHTEVLPEPDFQEHSAFTRGEQHPHAEVDSYTAPADSEESDWAEPDPHVAHEERERLEHMDVAGVFGNEQVVEAPQEEVQEEGQQGTDSQAGIDENSDSEPPTVSATGRWQETAKGVVEEEEIEEDELELPGFEENLDMADFEELEEEVLGPGDERFVPMGSELTEAVRDAHINERATGQYEAEGLDEHSEVEPEDEFGSSSALGRIMDEQEEEHESDGEFDESEETEDADAMGSEEEMEGARAEHRSASGTAGYQQPQRGGRRPADRRAGRRPGRRFRGRRPQAARQLPAISDLLKEGQEILVQIAKEPIAKKGARITSHIALPGRFLVYMPTVHHTGVSRKIASEEERHRLKRIVLSERGEAHGGFIVRTAAAGASEEDLRADIRFLINLWTEIRGRAETSKAPALIYHDLNLVERILRDQVTSGFSAIWADTEQEYERVLRFVSRFQPSLVRRVKLYSKDTPLFEQFNITDEINKALKSKVWLKSGGYIVINQTEALVAIDINTGKYVGKTARLEDTIVKTNMDAIKEIVRQIRLRDLGGIIVIDFIDMDERKNRQKVMQALEEALKSDRAPSKVLQFNDFGLVAITRKRVKQSLERTLGQPCPTCQATGMIKSVTTVCNEIYVELRKMARHFERDVMLRANPEVAKALKANGGRWLQEMEELTKRTILVKSDPLLHPEHFDIQ